MHWPNRGFCLLDLVVYCLLTCANSWQTCVCDCMREWWMLRVDWDSLWFTGKGFVWPARLIGTDCSEWESQTVAFSNVAVCLHGRSPGNEHSSSNRVPIITLSKQLSWLCQQFLWKARSYKNNAILRRFGGFIWLAHCRQTKSLQLFIQTYRVLGPLKFTYSCWMVVMQVNVNN